ncbi:unnamed protein product [Brassica rapa subsp. narinosa]
MVRILIDLTLMFYKSLWDEAASTFRGLLIILLLIPVTTVNTKIFGGTLYLNSTPATKFY